MKTKDKKKKLKVFLSVHCYIAWFGNFDTNGFDLFKGLFVFKILIPVYFWQEKLSSDSEMRGEKRN